MELIRIMYLNGATVRSGDKGVREGFVQFRVIFIGQVISALWIVFMR